MQLARLHRNVCPLVKRLVSTYLKLNCVAKKANAFEWILNRLGGPAGGDLRVANVWVRQGINVLLKRAQDALIVKGLHHQSNLS